MKVFPKVPVDVPQPVAIEFHEGRAVPSDATMAWKWWSVAWPRPTAQTYTFSHPPLAEIQARWDESADFVRRQKKIDANMAAKEAEAQAARDAVRVDEKKAELDELTATLKRRYLSFPGRTEEQFEKALPDLLEQYARQRALSGQDEPKFDKREWLA